MRRQHPEREDAHYLELRTEGKTIETIAWLCDTSTRTVRKGIKAAQMRRRKAVQQPEYPPRHDPVWVDEMIPLFVVGHYTPHSGCAHKRKIEPGSKFVCMNPDCHQSGMDDHPRMMRNPLVDPKPAVKSPAEPLLPEKRDPKEAVKTWVDPDAKLKPPPKPGPNRKERRQPTAA